MAPPSSVALASLHPKVVPSRAAATTCRVPASDHPTDHDDRSGLLTVSVATACVHCGVDVVTLLSRLPLMGDAASLHLVTGSASCIAGAACLNSLTLPARPNNMWKEGCRKRRVALLRARQWAGEHRGADLPGWARGSGPAKINFKACRDGGRTLAPLGSFGSFGSGRHAHLVGSAGRCAQRREMRLEAPPAPCARPPRDNITDSVCWWVAGLYLMSWHGRVCCVELERWRAVGIRRLRAEYRRFLRRNPDTPRRLQEPPS